MARTREDIGASDQRLEPYAPGTAPRLYRIRLESSQGRDATYGVTSWMGRDKAVAIAVEAHAERAGWPAYRVVVEEDERASLGPDGAWITPGDHLIDRAEW
jgi:hypothetical protein